MFTSLLCSTPELLNLWLQYHTACKRALYLLFIEPGIVFLFDCYNLVQDTFTILNCMLYWQKVLEELSYYRDRSYRCTYTNLQDPMCFTDFYYDTEETADQAEDSSRPILQQYFLTGQYSHIYLTQREAQCVYYLIQGCTIKQTGSALTLSPRTVEFYLKNIKKKLCLRKKKEVIRLLQSMQIFDASVLNNSVECK